MVRIYPAESAGDIELIRELFREYQNSLGIGLCFQNFENELAALPGKYAAPDGRLYLAFDGNQAVGCAGLRKIEDGVCELKRLYVRTAYRGRGVGRHLALEVLQDARKIGYSRLRLDTLPSMRRAQELYRSLGFKPIPPYTNNPLEGAQFLELDLMKD